MRVGANIRAERKRRGLTQPDLAARVRISPAYLSDIERDHRSPRVQLLSAIADALDVPVITLIHPHGLSLEPTASMPPSAA